MNFDELAVDDWLARAEGGDWLHHELAEIIRRLLVPPPETVTIDGYFDSDPDDPNTYSALRMFRDEFSPTIRKATEVIKGLQDENARLRTQVNDWLDVLVWAADSWPEGQPRLDDAVNRYEPWP